MKLYLYIILLSINCFILRAQVPYTDYQNPFPQMYLGMANGTVNDLMVDQDNIYIYGLIYKTSVQAQPLIFKKPNTGGFSYNVYHCNTQTRIYTTEFNSKLKNYFAFVSTDGTQGCSSGGLKIIKFRKSDLAIEDSVYFCDSTKPVAGSGFFIHNHFYVIGSYSHYYPPPLPFNYFKQRNLIRRIDTNLVLLNEQIIGDTSVNFGTYFLREAIDTGIVMNTLNMTEGCAMLIKLDTMGNEKWRKNYYTYAEVGGCSTGSNNGIMGLQSYANSYIALFNLDNGCNFYNRSIVAKMDRNGNLIKEVQYTSAGDTTLEFYSNFTNHTKRTQFYNILIKTHDGNFASVVCDRERYGFNNHENYIVILDTNLNIIHRSPKLGSLYAFQNPGLIQGADSIFYFGGGVMNSTNDGMKVRIYSYKAGGQVGIVEYSNEQPFKLYPNPVVNELTVETFENDQHVTIYNNMGQLVYNQTQSGTFKVNISIWATGLYLIELNDKEKHIKQTRKFIVE